MRQGLLLLPVLLVFAMPAGAQNVDLIKYGCAEQNEVSYPDVFSYNCYAARSAAPGDWKFLYEYTDGHFGHRDPAWPYYLCCVETAHQVFAGAISQCGWYSSSLEVVGYWIEYDYYGYDAVVAEANAWVNPYSWIRSHVSESVNAFGLIHQEAGPTMAVC